MTVNVEDFELPGVASDGGASKPLDIVHVVRDPLGGIIRNIRDLATAQVRSGHRVGLICGAFPDGPVRQSMPELSLGLHVSPIGRAPGLADIRAAKQVARLLRRINPDVVHGHGAKGGAYARLAGVGASIYSPHGGVLHQAGLKARPLFWAERWLLKRTDGLLFVAENEAEIFSRKIGRPVSNARVVRNGISGNEFREFSPGHKRFDVAFIGHLRPMKGVDDLLEALRILRSQGRRLRALIAGPGDEASVLAYRDFIARHDLEDVVFVPQSVDVTQTLSEAHLAVMPSRNEALGYFALEVAAMGMPLVASSAGGLPEVFGPTKDDLVNPADPSALAKAILETLQDLPRAQAQADVRRDYIRQSFTMESMVGGTSALYAAALASTARSRG